MLPPLTEWCCIVKYYSGESGEFKYCYATDLNRGEAFS